MSTFHQLPVKNIVEETPDTISLFFAVSDELQSKFDYKHGQYLTIKATINGEEVRRAYSMSSSPIEPELAVSVKRVKGGRMSNYLHDQVKVGDKLEVMEPEGRFFTELDPEQRKAYYLIGAGSGITPLMSIIKTTLEQEPLSSVYLLYGNRNEESIIFREQLEELQNKYGNQLFVEHVLSQPKKEKASGLTGLFKKAKSTWTGKTGRIDDAHINRFLDEFTTPPGVDAVFLLCGPGGLIDKAKSLLKARGVNEKNILEEYFTTNQLSEVEAAKMGADGAKATIHLDGQKIELEIPKGKTILDTLIAQKYDPPYSCTSGSCSTCMAKVIRGNADMEVCYALDDDEVRDGFILTCQAHPSTPEIELTFDV
jgi:ring-1,2-phenylacetyl-CoA epoxidase subunit PaaE